VEIDGSGSEFLEATGTQKSVYQLFERPYCSAESNGQTILPAPLSEPNPDSKASLGDRRHIFKQIIVKCVLQLLLIETTNDLLRNEQVYATIPPEHLLRLLGVLDHSYQFARHFNEDKELRTGLWKVGQ
jgi:brefeldin A-inhibited guanine nucleotide-exchange protein